MRNIIAFLLIPLIILLVGCADTYKTIKTGNDITLNQSSSAYISVPKDGRYGSKVYEGSGLTTTQILHKAFALHLDKLETGNQYQTFSEALKYARKSKVDYLVYSSILQWEDRITEWSAIPDKVSIKIQIIDVKSGKTLDSAIIEGRSGIATLGGDRPQDLLSKPVENYVSSLFR